MPYLDSNQAHQRRIEALEVQVGNLTGTLEAQTALLADLRDSVAPLPERVHQDLRAETVAFGGNGDHRQEARSPLPLR